MSSDKVLQPEKLISPKKQSVYTRVNLYNTGLIKLTDEDFFSFWFSGFTDGEGCFSISFRFLKRVKTGIEVRPSFSVGQKVSSNQKALFQRIKSLLGGGEFRIHRNCYKYETRSLKHITEKIIPFFDQFPLYTDKRESFLLFKTVCLRMAKGDHLCKKGLLEICAFVRGINPSGNRRINVDCFENHLRNLK